MTRLLFIVFIIFVSCQEAKPKNFTELDKQIKEKRSKISSDNLIGLDEFIKELRTMDLQTIKTKITNDIVEWEKEWEEEAEFQKAFYDNNYKRFDYDTIVPSNYSYSYGNDSLYIAYLKSGLKFIQTIKSDSAFIDMVETNYKLNEKINNYKKTDLEHYSSKTIFVKEIYYSDGTTEQGTDKKKYCPSPNIKHCFVTKSTKIIDSIAVKVVINRLKEVDSVVVTKQDLGKTVKGFDILKFDANYISLRYPKSTKIIAFKLPNPEVALDVKGNIITRKNSYSRELCGKTQKEDQETFKALLNREVDHLKKIKSKEEALKILENLELDYYLSCDSGATYVIEDKFYKGNVNTFKTYFETARKDIIIDVMYRNANSK